MKLILLIIAVFTVAYVYSTDPRENTIESETGCPCPRNYQPICASNHKTYSNKCLFECARKFFKQRNVDLKMVAERPCDEVYGKMIYE